MIQDRFKASNHSAGYRQLTLQLQKHYGVAVNHKVVYRIMKRLGIQSVARRRRSYNKYSDAIHRYENVLKRDFKAEQCNQKWATDITYVQTKQGVLYLSAIKDLYDGFIVSYKMGTEQKVHLVTMTIQDALQNEKAANGLALHSDQGFQVRQEALVA
jgi:putative transposase